jgi:hypothetical protein
MNPELMKLVGGAGAPGEAPPGAALGAPASAPVGSPMSTPEPKDGDKEGAYLQIQMAMDLLEKTLPALGSESEEGSTVIKALSLIGQKFGEKREKSKEFVPAELMSLMQQMPKGPAGAHPPGASGAPPGGMPPSPQPPM